MTRTEALKYRKKIEDGETVEALGGIEKTVEQSDKLGFDWIVTRVNGVAVSWVYVAQENTAGTVDNPIAWVSGMSLIPNAFYAANGKLYVCVKSGSPKTLAPTYFEEWT